MLEFLHLGVPTTNVQKGENYNPDLKVHITDPENHPFKFEYLRFEEGSPLPMIMQKQSHVAFKVDSIAKHLEGAEILVQPFEVCPGTQIAFIIKDNVIMELMECK